MNLSHNSDQIRIESDRSLGTKKFPVSVILTVKEATTYLISKTIGTFTFYELTKSFEMADSNFLS